MKTDWAQTAPLVDAKGYIWTIFVNAYADNFQHGHVGNVLDDDATARLAGAIACYKAGQEDAAKVCDKMPMIATYPDSCAAAIRAKR